MVEELFFPKIILDNLQNQELCNYAHLETWLQLMYDRPASGVAMLTGTFCFQDLSYVRRWMPELKWPGAFLCNLGAKPK